MCSSQTIDRLKEITAILNELDDMYASTKERDVELLANAITDMVLVLDTEGLIRCANPSSHRIIGVDPNELIGKNINQIIEGNISLSGSLNKTIDIETVGRDGEVRTVYMYVGELKDVSIHLYIAIVRRVK